MIPGTSDVARLPRLGKIRLGEKRKNANGKEYPASLDHFSFVDVPEVEEIYGKTCKELDILIPVEQIDAFFSQKLKAYRASGLFCSSDDGLEATRVRLGLSDGGEFTKVPKGQAFDRVGEDYIQKHGLAVEVGEMYDLPCPHEECPIFKTGKCKGIGRLMFLLPKVKRFGCYEISTSSWNGIVNVNNYLNAIRGAAGRVSMIPLKLKLVAQDAQVEGKKKVIHVLEIEFQGSITELQGYARKLLPAALPAAALPKEQPGEMPDDLTPHAGAALDESLGMKPKPPADAPADPAAAARAAMGTEEAPPDEEGSAQEEQPRRGHGLANLAGPKKSEYAQVAADGVKPPLKAAEPAAPAKKRSLWAQ